MEKPVSPGYLFDEIPLEHQISYTLRNARDYEIQSAWTNRYSNTHFYTTLFKWNLLGEETKILCLFLCSKANYQKLLDLRNNPLNNILSIDGIGYFTKLRLKFCMPNEHKFRHNLESLTPFCTCGIDKEDNEHFLLHYPWFNSMRQKRFCQFSDIPGLTLSSDDKHLCELLLFGD